MRRYTYIYIPIHVIPTLSHLRQNRSLVHVGVVTDESDDADHQEIHVSEPPELLEEGLWDERHKGVPTGDDGVVDVCATGTG